MERYFEFINGRRYARTPFGLLPGITTVLNETKPLAAKVALDKWRAKVGDLQAEKIKQDAIDRGILLHSEIESILKGEALPSFKSPFTEQAIAFLKEVSRVRDVERFIYHPIGFQSSVDFFCDLQGVPTVVDWKTGGKDSSIADPKRRSARMEDYYLQVAAYCKALEYLDGTPIKQAAIVLFIEGETSAKVYKITEDSINKHWAAFSDRVKKYQQFCNCTIDDW